MTPAPRRAHLPWLLACAVAGLAHTASFAPLGWWWLQPLALAVLAAAVLAPATRPAAAAACGAAFGLAWFGSGLWWVYVSLHDVGGLAWPLAAAAVALLCAFEAAYVAGAMALVAALRARRHTPGADALGFAAAWLGMELARAQWFTGFPWLASGYAHTSGPLAWLAPWVGVHAIAGVAAGLAAALALTLLRADAATRVQRQRQLAALWAGALALPLAGALAAAANPDGFTTSAGLLRVSLLQPAVAQTIKFDANQLQRHADAVVAQLAAAQGELLVTPETAIPIPQALWQPGQHAALLRAVGGRSALVGVFTGDDEAGWVNSLIAVDAAGAPYTYGKRHLLPFGEFIPPGFHWFVDALHIPIGDQARGSQTAPFAVAGQRVRPLICYEDLFGEDFAPSVVGPGNATLLVNATNLAWFGPLMVQDQHLQASQMRALEFERPLARATNTGATTVIDHQGRVTARLPQGQVGTLEAVVEGRSGSTPYARWLAALGLAPLWGLVGVVWLGLWISGRRGQGG